MATYKVIQDIEAEDKLLGPLTLRQFIYAAIVAVSGFVCFKLIFSTVWWLVILFIPHMVLFSMLAAPFGHDQPSEVWLLAKIRFFLKPRRRIWDQDGMKELVTITAPKRVEKQLTNNLTQTEVKSRLQALANTIDSRGWAIKNIDQNMYTASAYGQNSGSDRLIDATSLPQEVPGFDTQAVSDMFDEANSPTAQNLTQLMNASAQAHRQDIMTKMQQAQTPAAEPVYSEEGEAAKAKRRKNNGDKPPSPPPDYWFMNEGNAQGQALRPGYATFDHNPVVAPGMNDAGPVVSSVVPPVAGDPDEAALMEQIRRERSRPNPMNSRIKTIQPLDRTPSGTYTVDDQTAAAAPVGDTSIAAATSQSYADPATSQAYFDDTASASAPADDGTNEDGRIYHDQDEMVPENDQQNKTPTRDPAILMLAGNDDLNVATLARQANKARQVELSSDDEVVISLH